MKFEKYTGTEQTSIVNALAEMKIDSGFDYRKQIANANGIADYTGTAEQNLKMLGLLKAGELVRPEAATPATTEKPNNMLKYGGIAAAIALALYLAFKAGKNSKGEDAPVAKSDRERRRAELRRKKRQ